MNILIVDDDPIIRRILPAFCIMFSKQSTTVTAQNGEEALKILASEQVDLILTDVEMPVMDGCEFVTRVRELYPKTKIIVMTGLRCDRVDKRLHDVGISRYIEKPSTARELAKSIESVFKNRYGKAIPRAV
ncbi:MAG: response regulator [Dissulfurispiraceae bacterium]|jgi:two-component system, response regulator YesN